MEELKAAFTALNDKIKSCDNAGVNGGRVAELKELAAKFEEEFKKFEE